MHLNKSRNQATPLKSKGSSAVRPVTLRMIVTAERVGDGILLIPGTPQELSHVSVVARVESFTDPTDTGDVRRARQAPYRQLLLNDGTGRLLCRQWIPQGAADDAAPPPPPLGEAVHACGHIRFTPDGDVMLVASVCRLAADSHFMLLHFLDVIHTHCRLTYGPPLLAAGVPPPPPSHHHPSTLQPPHAAAPSLPHHPYQTGAAIPRGQPPSSFGAAGVSADRGPPLGKAEVLMDKVLHTVPQVIRRLDPTSSSGVHKATITRTVQNETGASHRIIIDALRQLLDDTTIISINDDEHFVVGGDDTY